jgi:hypothetical protein
MPDRIRNIAWLVLFLPSLVLGHAANSLAHEIRPAVATLTLGPEGRFELAVAVNLEAVIAGIGSEHRDTDDSPNAREYNRLRALPPEALRAELEAKAARYLDGIELRFDGGRASLTLAEVEIPPAGDVSLSRQSTVRLGGTVPAGAKALTFSYAARFGSCVLRVREGERMDAVWLKSGGRSAPYVIGRNFDQRTLADVLLDYTVLGFTHIVPKGLDHILFVLGLFLLGTHWKPLLIQVTAFTLAHTLTLALSVYGVVSLSPTIVEPLIAASIAYVAIENILTPQLKPWRALVVFGFGLLHGLGFAGVLEEVGLPPGQFVPALVSFNVGVELGQLAVIVAAYLAVGIWGRNRSWYRPRVVIPASAAIAAVGLYWTVQRVLGG